MVTQNDNSARKVEKMVNVDLLIGKHGRQERIGITKKDVGLILNWLLNSSFFNPHCPYTPHERELARKLIDYVDNKIGYPSIELRIRNSIQSDMEGKI